MWQWWRCVSLQANMLASLLSYITFFFICNSNVIVFLYAFTQIFINIYNRTGMKTTFRYSAHTHTHTSDYHVSSSTHFSRHRNVQTSESVNNTKLFITKLFNTKNPKLCLLNSKTFGGVPTLSSSHFIILSVYM